MSFLKKLFGKTSDTADAASPPTTQRGLAEYIINNAGHFFEDPTGVHWDQNREVLTVPQADNESPMYLGMGNLLNMIDGLSQDDIDERITTFLHPASVLPEEDYLMPMLRPADYADRDGTGLSRRHVQ